MMMTHSKILERNIIRSLKCVKLQIPVLQSGRKYSTVWGALKFFVRYTLIYYSGMGNRAVRSGLRIGTDCLT